MSTPIENFLFQYIKDDVELEPYLKEGSLYRFHPTYFPSGLYSYPRITYDLFQELPTTHLKGAKKEFDTVMAIDLWDKGPGAYTRVRGLWYILRGDPPERQKLHCYKGAKAGIEVQACLLDSFTADNTRPPFDSSGEPFYNLQAILNIYYKVLT